MFSQRVAIGSISAVVLSGLTVATVPTSGLIVQASAAQSAAVLGHQDKIADTPEVLYGDFLISLIGPTIQQAVDNYYGSPRRVAYKDVKVLNMRRLTPGSYQFEMTILVRSSQGPFNPPYGLDRITITNVPTLRVSAFVHQSV